MNRKAKIATAATIVAAVPALAYAWRVAPFYAAFVAYILFLIWFAIIIAIGSPPKRNDHE